jgi:transcriptional regulator with XRE-family HTH domain
MNYQSKSMERDEVLFAFHEAYERPTAENIIEWTRRYPQFADDIRAHAAVAWDWVDGPVESPQPADDTLVARAHSQALNLIHNAKPEGLPANSNVAASRTFQQMRQSAGKEIYQIAEDLDISRSVLSDLFGGRVKPPIGKRLSEKLITCLQTTSTEFLNALTSALNSPLLGHAKSTNAPRVAVRSYDEAIQRSDMSDARKRYWLEED